MARLRAAALGNYSIVVMLLLWEAVARSGLVNPRLFPPLGTIGSELIGLFTSGEVWPHLSATVLRVGSGFAMAAGLGVTFGLTLANSPRLRRIVEPVFTATYPIPRLPLYPIFIAAFGLGTLSIVALVTVECLYPITLNTLTGARSVKPLYVWSAQSMGAGPLRVFLKVALPASLPDIFSGLRIALPIAFVLAIAAELIGATEGMGFLVQYAASSFRRGQVFAAFIVIALVGYALDRLIAFARDRVVFWERREIRISGRGGDPTSTRPSKRDPAARDRQ